MKGVYVPVAPLWLCPWKRTSSTRSWDNVSPDGTFLLGHADLWHSAGWHRANFTLGHQGWAKKPDKCIPGPLQVLCPMGPSGNWTGDTCFTRREITKNVPKKTPLRCTYVCLRVAFCDCAHGKGHHQLGQGEGSFKEVLFSLPREQTWLATHNWMSGSQLCSRALRLGWETMKRYPWNILGPFAIGPSRNRTGNPPLHK